MLKMLMYPYQKQFNWVFEMMEKGLPVSVKAIGLEGDCRQTEYGERVCREIQFEQVLSEADILWILPTEIELDFEKYIFPKVKSAVKNNKKILCTRELESHEMEILKNTVPEKLWVKQEVRVPEYEKNNFIFDIDAPVVYVVGISRQINSTEHLVKLQQEFASEQYKTVIFSDAPEVLLFENGYFLSMLKNNSLSNTERFIKMNHFIKQIEIQENPDLIIMGIMNGAVSLGMDIIEDFGIDVYGAARTVRPDCVVANVFYGEYKKGMLEEIGKEIQRTMGEEVDFYNITNQIMDSKESDMLKRVSTIEVEKSMVHHLLGCLSQNDVFGLNSDKEYERLTVSIINKLSEYADVISM